MTPCSAAACGSFSSRAELAVGLLAHVLGHVDRVELLAQLLGLGLRRVALPELLLDRLELLAQDVLALGAVELGLDLGLDARADRGDLELAREDLREPPQPPGDVELLQQRLLLLRLDAQRARRSGARARTGRRGWRRRRELLGQVRDVLDDVPERLLDVAHERGQLRPLLQLVGRLGHRARRGRAARPVNSSRRTRGPAWTRIRSVPSGTLSMRATVPTTPTGGAGRAAARRSPGRARRRARASGRRRARR